MSAVEPLPPTIVPEQPIDPRGLGGLLLLLEKPRPLPLVDVKVRATIAGDTCRTVVEQRFRNAMDQPVEAVHIFPLPEDGAVTEVELRCGDLVVKAECRERKEAEKVFDEARQQGHRAALLTQERDDVHTLRVTNLPPGQEVTVRIVVVERLSWADGGARWRFPTVIAPRYLPGNAVGHEGPGVLPDSDSAPDASRLQPPLRMEGGTKLDLEVQVAGPVESVASSLHAVKLTLADGGVRVAPSGAATLDRDFVLEVRPPAAVGAGIRAWGDGLYTLIVVDPPAVVKAALPRDAVFVVDISGSMGGVKIEAARKALIAALHGLMPGDRFKLIAFDDRIETFKAEFVAYDDRNLKAADAWVANLRARGGTEMLPAIKAALDGDTPAGRLRTVLFVTDGQAHNEQELVAAVAHRRGQARFFSLGIDTAVNAALLQRLARVGGGTCELATPEDDVEAVIARVEARFGSPLADDVRPEGLTAGRPDGAVLFSGRPAVILAEGSPARVAVTARSPSGPTRLEAEVRPSPLPLGPLWARERVAWLEDRLTLKPFEEEAIRPEILRVALAHGIASKYTAFVAVERTQTVTGQRVEVVQPAELPHGWSESFRSAPVVVGASAPTGGVIPRPAPAPAQPMMSAAPARMRSMAQKKGRPSLADDADDGIVSAPPPAIVFDAMEMEAPAEAAPTRGFARDEKARSADPAGELARTQSADGSFGADVRRTAAALVLLVLLGHTRRTGVRQRTVQKAATWLADRAEAAAKGAIAFLEAAERGEKPVPDPVLRALRDAGPEGAMLAASL